LNQGLQPHKECCELSNDLSSAGVPVNVNVAPIIPSINDEGIFDVVKAVAENGASSAM